MRKILYIINPVAGHGKGKDYIKAINDFMEMRDIAYEIKISNRLGNITEITKSACDKDFTDIVIVGGDGSLVEALNGMDLTKDISLGIIPAGTGNDYARVLNLSREFDVAMETIITAKTKMVDIGMVNQTKFINVCCCGIDGEIIMDTDKIKKHIRGSAAYFLATIKNLASYKAKKVVIDIDGKKIKREVILAAIGKGQYVGGGMRITPTADLTDGQFEICIVNKLAKPKLIALFPSIFKGEHVNIKPTVEVFKGKNVKINTIEDRLLVEADGNIIGTTPIEVSINNQKIKMIYREN